MSPRARARARAGGGAGGGGGGDCSHAWAGSVGAESSWVPSLVVIFKTWSQVRAPGPGPRAPAAPCAALSFGPPPVPRPRSPLSESARRDAAGASCIGAAPAARQSPGGSALLPGGLAALFCALLALPSFAPRSPLHHCAHALSAAAASEVDLPLRPVSRPSQPYESAIRVRHPSPPGRSSRRRITRAQVPPAAEGEARAARRATAGACVYTAAAGRIYAAAAGRVYAAAAGRVYAAAAGRVLSERSAHDADASAPRR